MKSAFLFGGTADLLAFVQPSALVDYQFRLQGTLTNYGSVGGSLPYTRAGNGTFIGSNGLLQTASTNVARFDFDPVSLTRLGLLFEGQATNYVPYSETFTSGWGGTTGGGASATKTTYTGLLPNGSTGTVDRLTFGSISSAGYYVFYFASTSLAQSSINTVGCSAWIKRVSGGNRIGIAVLSASSTGAVVYGYAQSIFTPTTEWQRFDFVSALAGSKLGTTNFTIGFDNRLGNFASYSAITIDVYGAQLQLDRVDSYIPTTGSTATRFADAASMTGLPTTNVTLVEKPAGCATLSAGTLTLNPGYTIDRIMVLPGTYSADQVATIRGLM